MSGKNFLRPFGFLARGAGAVLAFFLGSVRLGWSPPPWLRGMGRHPRAVGVMLLLTAAAGYGGLRWWQWREAHQPRPRELVEVRKVEATVTPPGLPSYDLKKGELSCPEFSLHFPKDAAPLEIISQVGAPKGITLKPAWPGKWVWGNATNLTFMPDKALPAGTKFTVKLSAEALAPHTELTKAEYEFTTPALTGTWGANEFYTDPSDPGVHQAVFTVNFNQPVKADEMSAHVRATAIGSAALFTQGGTTEVIADAKDANVLHVRTPKITIPVFEDFARLSIDKDLHAMNGGEPLGREMVEKVAVPTRGSGFRFTAAKVILASNEEGDPQQTLTLEATSAADPNAVVKAVEAFLLPEKKKETVTKEENDKDQDDQDQNTADNEEEEEPATYTPDEITPELLAKAKRVTLTLVEDESDAPVKKFFGFHLPPSKPGQMYVRVRKGLAVPGGFVLDADFTEMVTVPGFARSVEVAGAGGVLALNGERKLSIKSRGFEHLRFTLARVPAGQINHLVSQTSGEFQAPEFKEGLSFENLARFHSSVQHIVKRNDYEANYSSFDFAPALAREDASDPEPSRGLFQLEVEGVRRRLEADGEPEKNDPDPGWVALNGGGQAVKWGDEDSKDAGDKRFILITDLGLLVKRNADGTREVFVQSFRQQTPVGGVVITALAKNGEPLAEATTGADGHASLPALDGLKREHKPVAIVARKGTDLSFLPWARDNRSVELSRFDISGIKGSEPKALDAFLFTERGIYRPGDAIHLAAIVRTRDWDGRLAGLPVEAVVIDAKEQEAGRFTAKLPRDGFLEFTIPTEETSPTGVWRLELRRPKTGKEKKQRHQDAENVEQDDDISIGHMVVRVEEFQPDRMKMIAQLDPAPGSGWVKPEELKAKVELQTLFGIAAADRRVTGKMRVSAGGANFSAWEDWTFHLPKPVNFESQQVELGERKSGADGRAEFVLDLKAYTAPLLRVGLELEAFEADGGHGVRGGLSTLVSPYDVLLGWKGGEDLGFLKRDVPHQVRLVAIGPDLKPVAVDKLKRVLIETRQVSVLTKQDNGSMAYVSREKKKEIEVVDAALPAAEMTVDLPVSRAGLFTYEWRDEAGLVRCSFTFHVVGPGEQDRNLERDTELELTLPEREWKAGEQLEVALRAPYTGAGLITIERERVIAWQWFKADTASSVQHITVPPGLEGGAYVHVAFVRGLDSPEIFTSPLSVGVAPFRVAADRRMLEVTLDTPERARPGEPLKIGFRTPRPARVAVWAVDEGIHRVTSYHAPEPLEYLLRRRALEVWSWQILDLLMPEYSLLKNARAFGGDGDEPPELALGLNPFKRKRAEPVVFWSGIVEAGPNRKEVVYNVPDFFAGRLNIMAAVVAPEAVGVAEKHTVIKGPMVLTQNMPLFAVPGDEFVASLTIANQMEGAAATDKITVKTEPSTALEVIEAPKEAVTIPVNTEATVHVRVRVKETLGNAELKFTAAAGHERVELKSTMSVRPATPFVTEVKGGWFRQPMYEAAVGREMFPQYARREAVISPTPLGLARGLEAYLRQYPHGCSEQITSKTFPWLVLKDEADFAMPQEEAARVVAQTCRVLASRQLPDGGFGYWTAGDETPGFDYLTVYVTHFLIEAQAAGFEVPESLLGGALRRLKLMAAAKVTSRDEANVQAAAIYLLTRNGEVTTNYALNLTDTLERMAKDVWVRDLSAAWLAGTWSLLKKDKEAETLMASHLNARAKTPFFGNTEYYYNSPLTEAAQSLTVLCRHFPGLAAQLGYDDLKPLTEGIGRGDFDTLSASWSIVALKSYAGLMKQGGIKLGLEAGSGGQWKALGVPRSGLFSSAFEADAKQVRFLLNVPKGGPDLGAWFQTLEAGYAKALPAAPQTSGLEMTREFLNEKGQPVTSAKVGETLTLRLRVRNTNQTAQRHLALVDLLPGGFENAPDALKPGLATIHDAEYVDVREDRNLLFTELPPGTSHTFKWEVRPGVAGTFTVPPAFGEAMYDRAVHGSGAAGKFTVLPRE
jgi:hypothetical protein